MNPRNRSLQFSNRKHTVLPTGQYKIVGCRDVMIGFSKKGGSLVRLYYPAADQSRTIEEKYSLWPNWFPHENYRKGFGEVIGIRWPPLLNVVSRIVGEVFIPAIPNAKPMRRGEPYPVVVLSHGLGACRTTYSGICMELASQGFVVAAVEHRDNSACLSFYAKQVRMSMKDSNPNFFFNSGDNVDAEDEADFGDELDDPNYVPPKALTPLIPIPHITMEWVRHRSMPFWKTGKKIYNFRNRQIQHRVRECSRALDLLEALQAGYELNNILDPLFDSTDFEGMLDLDKAIVMGHSLGGATAIMAAAIEMRFKLIICLDVWMYPIEDEPFDLVTQPILCVNSENFEFERNLNKMKELMVASHCSAFAGNQLNSSEFSEMRKAVTIKGSTHFNYTDVPFILNWFGKKIFHASSKRSPISVQDLTMALALTFMKKHLDVPIPTEDKEMYLTEKKKKLRATFKDL